MTGPTHLAAAGGGGTLPRPLVLMGIPLVGLLLTAFFIFLLPALALLFGSYLYVGLQENSRVQAPETLFRERRMLAVAALLVALLFLLSWVDIPQLDLLTEPHYIAIPQR